MKSRITAAADAFVRRLEKTECFIPAYVNVAAIELRTAFKFVRNEYMHNVQELTSAQCYALLARISGLLLTVDDCSAALSHAT
jgi:hypothetical protein